MTTVVKYKPLPCSEGEVFSGDVQIKKLTMPQKLEAMKKFKGFDENDPDQLGALIEWSKPFFASVNIKNKVDGSVYASIDDLINDAETIEIIIDVATAVLMGAGKKKSQKALTDNQPKKTEESTSSEGKSESSPTVSVT